MGDLPKLIGPLPGPRARAIIERDARVVSPSYTRSYPLVAERGEGAIIEDVDGNRFLDFSAGIAVVATGHCHPRVVEAIRKQAARLLPAQRAQVDRPGARTRQHDDALLVVPEPKQDAYQGALAHSGRAHDAGRRARDATFRRPARWVGAVQSSGTLLGHEAGGRQHGPE